jgi:hypothetical protein
MKARALIVAVLLVVIAALIFWEFNRSPGPVVANDTPVANTNDNQLKQDTAKAELLKAILNVYYVYHGKYPITLDRLGEDIQENPSQIYGDTNKGATSLQDVRGLKGLDYTVRGDSQAYKFIYTDAAGVDQSVEGNYSHDYH